jgi:nucleotide-binding universal stress UspA family protein
MELIMSANRMLVGVDGSDGARRAIEWAIRYAQLMGAEVVAAHVITYSKELVRDLPPTGLTNWRRDLAAVMRDEWSKPLRTAGVAHRVVLKEHDSVEAGLLELADTEDVEIVVLGARGHGDLANRILGAVTYRVSHAARRPVVIVPVDWHEAEMASRS